MSKRNSCNKNTIEKVKIGQVRADKYATIVIVHNIDEDGIILQVDDYLYQHITPPGALWFQFTTFVLGNL